ncbi:MAG: hypothetical protein ACXVPQ_00125 [Bacteroidia bacterium]
MMRLFLRGGLLLFITLAVTLSCGKKKKKDWQCTCVVSDTGNVMLSNASKFIERFTKAQADTSCSNYGLHIQQPFSTTNSQSSYSCSVK